MFFYEFMLTNTKHTSPNKQKEPLYKGVRAGALKSQLLIYASIVEAGLLSHILKRKE